MPSLYEELVWFDIPKGVWRVFFVIETMQTAPGTEYNIDMLSHASCAAMLEAVYKPHYEHFSSYFGNTFAGFFSDEPGFGNDNNTYQSKLGKRNMLIPWNENVIINMAKSHGYDIDEIEYFLPFLWFQHPESATFRVNYMDIVSRMARENFSEQIGNWCRNHSVSYIGHCIEDMNSHMRLGYGLGHFFRGLDGQDMAGMDLVLGQIVPGIYDQQIAAPVIENLVDPDFFVYTLPKMTASHAHTSMLKKGRALCEIFGAFGWAEGLPEMKQLFDLMLVSGINYYVPHAFSPKFPDTDCPPHFWANGKNTNYPLFGELIGYMKRCCHLISDGKHCCDGAVLYNAEAEWSGCEYMLPQQVCKVLIQNQIDFDILSTDMLKVSQFKENRIICNEEVYSFLVVPYSEYLSEETLNRIDTAAAAGVPVYFIHQYPKNYYVIKDNCRRVELDLLPEILHKDNLQLHVYINDEKNPHLRFYYYSHADGNLIFFLNDSQTEILHCNVTLPNITKGAYYNVWNGEMRRADFIQGGLELVLQPGETVFFFPGIDAPQLVPMSSFEPIELLFDVYGKDVKSEDFKLLLKNTAPVNITGSNLNPNFSGILRYKTTLLCENQNNIMEIDLGEVGETAHLWVNGIDCGCAISKPYRFFIADAVDKGNNIIEIEVTNSLAYAWKDGFSKYQAISPSGILGPVKVSFAK